MGRLLSVRALYFVVMDEILLVTQAPTRDYLVGVEVTDYRDAFHKIRTSGS